MQQLSQQEHQSAAKLFSIKKALGYDTPNEALLARVWESHLALESELAAERKVSHKLREQIKGEKA